MYGLEFSDTCVRGLSLSVLPVPHSLLIPLQTLAFTLRYLLSKFSSFHEVLRSHVVGDRRLTVCIEGMFEGCLRCLYHGQHAFRLLIEHRYVTVKPACLFGHKSNTP